MILIWQRVVSRSSAILAPACLGLGSGLRLGSGLGLGLGLGLTLTLTLTRGEVAWCAEVAWRGCSYGAWRGEGQGRMLVLREVAR